MNRYYLNSLLIFLLLCSSCKKAEQVAQNQGNENRQTSAVNSQSNDFLSITNTKTLRTEAEFNQLQNDLSVELQKLEMNEERVWEFLTLLLENDEVGTYRYLVQAEGVSSYTLVNEILFKHLLNERGVNTLAASIQILDQKPDIGTPLLGMVLKARAKEDAAKAYEWLCKHADFSGASNAAMEVGSVVGLLESPLELLTSIESKDPPLQVVSPFIRGVIESWAAHARSPEEAGQWLNIFPPQDVVDEAVYSYVNQARQNDPKAAMSWAESISDEGLRRSAILETASVWEKRDPESFVQWKGYSEEQQLP